MAACNYQAASAAPARASTFKDYSLSSDVLFAFGKSGYADISPSGRKAIRELVTQLRTSHPNLEQIEVIGHTDPIGKPAANHALGLKRAHTVRRLLVDGGLSAADIKVSSAAADDLVTRAAKARGPSKWPVMHPTAASWCGLTCCLKPSVVPTTGAVFCAVFFAC